MLKRILLLKPWGDHVAGEIVQVDPVRAGRLILDGTGAEDFAEVQCSPRGCETVTSPPPTVKGKPKA